MLKTFENNENSSIRQKPFAEIHHHLILQLISLK